MSNADVKSKIFLAFPLAGVKAKLILVLPFLLALYSASTDYSLLASLDVDPGLNLNC